MNRHDPDYHPQGQFARLPLGGRWHAALPPILEASRCYGTFGSGDKTQTTTDIQTGASDDATNTTQTGVNALSLGSGNSQGGYGNINVLDQQTGGTRLGDGAKLNLGTVAGNTVGGDVTVGYDAGQFQTALQTVGSNLSNAVTAQQEAAQKNLDSVLSQLSTLAESAQTDGESGKNQIVLYVVLAVVGLVGWIFYRK